MKKLLLTAAMLVASAIGMNISAQGTWTAPAAPGEDLSTLSESTDVFIYNIEADAIFSRGFNWLTMALADRPEGGDNAVPAARQKVQIRKDGNNIKIHWNDRGSDVFFGQAGNTDAGQMWTDLGNAGNRVVFTPAASENYPNTYTLTNVEHNLKVDVLWARGGKLTLWNGKGYYDWAFLTGEAFTSGKLAQFKVRKAMWNLYQALEKANAVAANAEALNTALAVYTNESASVDDLRAAFRTMFLATAASIEDPVDVSYMFTHPDMSGDRTAAGWSYSDFTFKAGEFEKYHAAFTSTQTITDAPNGLYDVVFTGIYRQDDGQSQAAPQLIVSNGATEASSNFPNMDLLGTYWNIGGDPTGDWVNSSTGKRPNWMWSASDAQTNDYAIASVENIKVNANTLGVTFQVTGGNQWFNFQRVFITYKGSINAGLYKTLQNKIQEATDFVTANNGVILASFITAINNALSSAEGLTANSNEDELTNAYNAINDALSAAISAPTIANLELLQATVTLAAADGVNTTEAQALIDNPTTESAVIEALSALRLARRVINAETHANVFAGNAPAAGDYYLYNVGTGRFFCGGDDWGAHAALGFPGIIVTLEGEGTYKINTHLQNGDDNGNPKYYLNYGGYCDTWTGDTWTFTEVGEGVYNIARSSDNNLFLGYSTATYNRIDTDKSGADNPNNQWKLVTKADRDALLATATEDAPQDASYLIKSPGFSQREDVSAWTFTNASIWGRGGNHPDFAIEAYNQTSATVEQTVTGLPAGTYELKVQAFYRDGNFDTQVNILAGGGDARQLATLYAGTKSALIQNVSGGADKAPGMGRGSSVGYMPDGIDDACLYFQTGLYWATLDEIVVGQDGTMTIGARKTEKLNDGDWMVLDNFRLIYKGAGIDLTGVKADLLAKIGEATTLLNNLNLNLSFLATAKTNGQSVYDNSTDADEIVAATNALQAAINQANAATNITVYKQTVALAETEGIDTNTSKATLEGVTDGSTFASVVTSELNNVRTARRLNAVDKQPDIFTGSAPQDGGQYYIYNVGAQRYLTGGVDYGTHAAVNYAAQIATFTQVGEGWRIHTNIRTNSDALNHNGFVDCGGDGDTWYLIEVSTGVYNISRTNSNTDATLLGYSGERRGNWWQVDTDNQGADQAINQWKLVTKAERDALMAYASEENPVDATYYIHAAGFDHHLPAAQLAFPLTQWQTWFPEGKGGANGIGGWEPDFNWEAWNSGNIKFFQELKDLPAGKYRLTAQAYYRHGNFEQAVSEFDNPKTDGAILYATNGDGETAQSYIVPITSEVNKVPGYGRSSSVGSFPDDRNETAAQFFEAGLYKNVVNDIIVTADGKLTIGIEKFENNQGSEWVVADNFRLTCLGLTPLVTVTDALYATYVAPYDVDFTGAKVSAYAAQTKDVYVHLEPVTTVPAGEAVVVKAAAAGTYAVAKTSGATLTVKNDLIAATTDVTADGSQYILAKLGDVVGFAQAEKSTTIAAGKGYLVLSAPVKAFYPFGDDDATGIEMVNGQSSMVNGPIYNVAGQKLSKMQKGINIMNGKKILK